MLKTIANQKGMAAIEMIPVLLMFVVLLNFSLGFFGVIHSGILNSIAARNYAFETFRNRTNLNYIRDEYSEGTDPNIVSYTATGVRFHGIVDESAEDNKWIATQRPIKFTDTKDFEGDKAPASEHNTKIRQMTDEKAATRKTFSATLKDSGGSWGVNPVWIMTIYGICLNSECKRL